MQQAIHNADEKQGKGGEGRRDVRPLRISELTQEEFDRMRMALNVLLAWNNANLLDGTEPTKKHTREVIAKALGIQEDVA